MPNAYCILIPRKQLYQLFSSTLFLLLSLLSSSQAQQYFENPIILKNAQVGHVTDAIVDNNGFLWIAGTGGLNRYDGQQHKYFRYDPNDSLSLFSNYINDIFFDEEHNQLWLSTTHPEKSGISILDLETEQIKNIQFDEDGSAGFAGRNLLWICKDHFGSYWISVGGKGLLKFLPEQDSIIPIQYQPDEKDAGADLGQVHAFLNYSFDVWNDSIMWIGSGDGLLKFNVGTHQFTKYRLDGPLESNYRIRCLLHHSDNQVYVGTWSNNGLYRFDPDEEQFTKIEIEISPYYRTDYITNIRGLVSKSSNRLWVTTDAGLMEYDLQKNKVTPIKKNDYTKEIYHGVYQVDQKNRALFWIGNSFYLFDPLRQQNKVYTHEAKKQKEPQGFIVRRVIEEEQNGKLWIAAQYSEGLYRLDLQTENWEIFPPPKSYFKDNDDVSVWDVLKTKSGEILALLSGKIYRVSEQEKKLIPWHLQPNANSEKSRRMIEDSKGNIWVGIDFEGVFKINQETKTIRHFKKEFHLPDSLGIGWVKDLKEDRNGNIWICSNGYNVYDPLKDTIYSFPYFLPDKKTWYEIYGLGIDGEGNVWIGSENKGIGITDADHPEKGIVSYFDNSNGLNASGSYRLLLDQKKNVWSWMDGFTKINLDRSAKQYFNSNYFSINQFWSMTQLANGNIVLGDRKGISIFNPDSLRINEELAQPYILSFKVFDKERKLASSPFQSTNVHLKPNENFFSMEFSALNPIFFGSTEFLYQLEGIDPDWVNPQNRRYVAYTNIPGGSYNFKLKAKNNEGVWNETPYVFRIHIAIPWYRTWWSYVSYAVLFFGMLYYWYRFRSNQRLEKAEALRLQELDTFKTRFYANITHEFRTPLTVIQGMAIELKTNPDKAPQKNLNLIEKNSKNLLALVNQMLDLSKLQAGKVNLDLQQDDIIIFIKYLVETHESFAKLQNVGLQFYSDEKELLMDFDPKKIEQILTNLISNAVKFTPEYGKVLVVAKKVTEKNQPHLQILVKDNGIGISKEQLPYIFDRFHQANPTHENQGTGIGLALVKELMGIMEASITVESEPDNGTTFFLEFPIQNKALLVLQNDPYKFKTLAHQEDLLNPVSDLSTNEFPILLIIEDNADVTYYLQTCLQDQYQILTSRNGKEGIEKAFEILPDIIISDVMMPVMDGFEVCATLKEDERTSHIPIILLTAKATSEDKLLGLTHGADAYLIKPFEKAELIIRLTKLLEIRQILQKKYGSTLISSQANHTSLENKEDSFIEKTQKIILSHLEEEDFYIDELARELHFSRSQVHRKIKALTGMSTAIYIRHIRLQKAKELLASTELSISEIAYQVGFKTPVYFSQAFKETFGESPNATRK